jgi:glycosyltransferase involved in cell wall biosynthesis
MEQDVSDSIDFSVIVPTHDRPSQLAACLDGLANLQYPRTKFEVVVVDDGSEVSAEPVIAPYRECLQVTFRSQLHGGPAQARNAGAKISRGRFLAFTDDDCTPAPDWLDKLAAQLNGASNQVVGGRTVNALSENVFATASQSLISYLCDYYNADPKKARFLVSCNLALPAESFRSVDGFDPAYPRAAAEDRDLCGHGVSPVSAGRHPTVVVRGRAAAFEPSRQCCWISLRMGAPGDAAERVFHPLIPNIMGRRSRSELMKGLLTSVRNRLGPCGGSATARGRTWGRLMSPST